VPEYLQEAYGPYITGGYRSELTLRAALMTLFTIHNESGNIWSHILGFFVMVGFGSYFIFSTSEYDHEAPRWPHVLYIIGSLYVLAVSTTAHLLCCMGRKAYTMVWKFDYSAIAVVMWSMYVPWCWYIFACDTPVIKAVYIGVSGILALSCVALGLSDTFQDPKYHHLQPACFCLLGASGLAPMLHAALWFWSVWNVKIALLLTAMQMLCNLIGAVLFSTRFPEKYFPGKLNAWGHSHFIMHILVVIAFVCYFYAGLLLWQWRSANVCNN
jgi:adiponectin receptor